ncbi:MAG: type VI secretion system baseplate subunit TssE [Planctomycetes bacterium]|nr:type VI secretion system baseplate subunit TssE [Planctomycetota bacterium]
MQSLLDRLTDHDPDRELEVPLSGRPLERLLREAIRRDIESFLNARRRCVPLPAELERVHGTILDYGVPDFVGHTLSTERRRRQFLKRIVEHLKQHEPRFKSVDIEIVGGLDQVERSFHFRIKAVVFAEPAPESLSFDSRVEPVTRAFSIKVK